MNLLLTNTMFDRENDNVLLFNNKEELAQYFDNLTNKVLIEDVNFNANDIINTSVYVKVNEDLNLLTLLNYNYCVVKQGENLPNLYYFIERSQQDNGPYIKLDLTLDAINTYIYDIVGENILTQGLIQKTHLDRFFKKDNKYIFNFKNTSPLFEREMIKNTSKRITNKKSLIPKIDNTNNSKLNKWINENVQCWCYVFLSGNVNYKWYNFGSTEQNENEIKTMQYVKNIEGVDSNFVVLAFPLMKSNKYLNIQASYNGIKYRFNNVGFDLFRIINNNYAPIQSIKFSILPPTMFENKEYTENTDYIIEDNQLTLIVPSTTNFISGSAYNSQITNYCAYIQLNQYINEGLILYLEDELTKWEYSTENINDEIEPKLLNEDYSVYKLFIGGQQYEIPISKTSNIPSFKYREVITPDISKINICFNTASSPFENEQIFINETEKDFSGFNLTLDLSMWYPSEELQNYLASNKNYLQIFSNNQRQEKISNALSIGGDLIGQTQKALSTGSIGGFVEAGINSALKTTNLLIKQNTERQNLDLTIDNMSNSPASTSNINSNAILINFVSGIEIFIEKLELLPFEKSIIVDNFKMFGYNYNKICYINDYIKTRKYYNYIQAIIYDIDAQIAEQVKDRIKEIFSKGIRFWHADAWEDISQVQINFNLNNIERSIT